MPSLSQAKQLSSYNIGELKEVFDAFNADGTGYLFPKEVKYAIRALGFETNKDSVTNMLEDLPEFSDVENTLRLKQLDQRSDEWHVNWEGWQKMMRTRMVTRNPQTEIMKAFHIFNSDQSGKLTFRNLKEVCKELGENMSDGEIQEMIDMAGDAGASEISFQQFAAVMSESKLF